MESGGSANDTYQISKVGNGLKEYYISKTNYNGPFGTGDVISPSGSGTNRFYVMALNDVDNNTYTWNQANRFEQGQWSVPSREEWAAFGGQLGITTSNYSGYGLNYGYWSSSATYAIVFNLGYIGLNASYYDYPLRLCTTF